MQENMSLGVVSNTTDFFDLVNGREVQLDFEYAPGFKVALGMNLNHDKWDTLLQYTWYRATSKVHKTLDPFNLNISLLPAWIIPSSLSPNFSYGSETWKLKLDLLDWDLARSYHVGKQLCFRPFVGIRGALIHQNVRVNYLNQNPSTLALFPNTYVTQTSHSWGVGPRIGLSSDWNLGRGFRIYSEGEMDILYTQYTHLKLTQTSTTATPNRYIVREHDASYLRTHLELNLGLGWETYFACNKYHIDLSADYGFQVFFDQNMFRNTVINYAVGKSISPNGDLFIQGLTATARFDF